MTGTLILFAVASCGFLALVLGLLVHADRSRRRHVARLRRIKPKDDAAVPAPNRDPAPKKIPTERDLPPD